MGWPGNGEHAEVIEILINSSYLRRMNIVKKSPSADGENMESNQSLKKEPMCKKLRYIKGITLKHIRELKASDKLKR